MKRNLGRKLTYRNKLIFITVSTIICVISLFISDKLARELQIKEKKEVNLWSLATSKMGNERSSDIRSERDELINAIRSNNTTIPFIITDEKRNVMETNLPKNIVSNPETVDKMIRNMANKNDVITLDMNYGTRFRYYYVFYGNSIVINLLRFFPIVSLIIILIFVSFSYITYNSSKRDEQNKVWIGMAKETAHQLGTPTSSLLGWIEYLKSQNADPQVITEMTKDIDRLLTVVDRFSKIGSKTVLEPLNITDVAINSVNYFKQRISKKVVLSFHSLEELPLVANANEVLFGWVLENLIRNSVDALGGEGTISVTTYCDKKWIYVDVTDSGKGIAPSKIDDIFKPGFTTKSRGWGLGLSLSKRIVEQYHKGRIFVANSVIDKGTTIRVMIKKM